MSTPRAFTHDDYTVGWICALPKELAASDLMLDNHHPALPQPRADTNCYTLGSIGSHNVVMACLPAGQKGPSTAATVAIQMTRTFRSLRFGLMVGVGGGMPSESHDIRLGDVVVSKPSSRNGGVVQYDSGKTVQSGEFKQSDSLNPPPLVLLNALSTLQARHENNPQSFAEYLSEIPAQLRHKYAYPGITKDRLFPHDYEHVDEHKVCGEVCDDAMALHRRDRPSTKPFVHYGTIVSGNQVIMHGTTRENLRQKFNCLCIEMEAAGLVRNFPCVVIRGICDYADSHKSGKWKKHASATAAAYAKELLNVVPVEEVSNSAVAQALPSTCLVLSKILIPKDRVALGRLVINTQQPWQDFFPELVTVDPMDISIEHVPRMRDIMKKSTSFYNKISAVFSSSGLGAETIASVPETTYSLLNAGKYFRRLCGEFNTRVWFGEVLKYYRNIYMAVAIHTVQSLETGQFKEQVFAIQYQKVKFTWYLPRHVNNAFLDLACHRWQPAVIEGRTVPEGEAKILEADLQEYLMEGDLEDLDEVYVVGDELIVV